MKLSLASKLVLGLGLITTLAACDDDYAYYDNDRPRYSYHRYDRDRETGGVSEVRRDVRRHISHRANEVGEVRRDTRRVIFGSNRTVDRRYDPAYDRRYDTRYDGTYDRRVVERRVYY